jgi:small subunit ribosomal protein S8
MTNYQVADFLIRLKNAVMADKKEVEMKSTKLILAVAKTLKDEKYISNLVLDKNGNIKVTLSIFAKKPILRDVRIVSKPGLRIYVNVDELKNKRGPEIYILSTNKGVMSDKVAIKKNLGGELIAKIS